MDVNTKDRDGRTPLHNLIINWDNLYIKYYKGSLGETVRTLIESGANVNAKDKEGYTPLHWVAMIDEFDRYQWVREIVPILVENGADVNAKNNGGKTTLQLALKYNNKITAEELRKHGAKE